MAAAVLVGVAIRLVFAFTAGPDDPLDFGISDPSYYHYQANLVAEGVGFVDPFDYGFRFLTAPSATHPPAYVLLLASGSFVGATTLRWHQVLSIGIGAIAIVLIALVGRRVAGARAGVAAAAAAAVYPHFWLNDTTLTAETLFALTAALVLLVTLEFLERPTLRATAAMGVVVGVATLTRGEGILYLPLLVLPAVCARSGSLRRVAGLGVLVTATALLTIAPWVVRNVTSFEEPVLISTNADDVIGGSNCPPSYEGEGIGSWHISCLTAKREGEDESQTTRRHRTMAIRYAQDHWTELPKVGAVRVARLWDLYRPFENNAAGLARPEWASRLVLFGYWAVLPFAVGGAVLLRRRRATVLVLLAPVVLVTLTALATWGAIRFRVPAEVSFMVLFGVAVDWLIHRRPVRLPRDRAATSP